MLPEADPARERVVTVPLEVPSASHVAAHDMVLCIAGAGPVVKCARFGGDSVPLAWNEIRMPPGFGRTP